ncbi:TetR/AcrR family transcriptional regulator C-terminal ligand-binding domain-containing protein [Streptomonospora halophila]|uniref:TetR/AcrR family transcriptional regulator C-terminal ligand-binding domain-containing protein n=1 Tax=Streptomonospora halophila TaxID=427369 RepID=A0ABP9G6R7_9ACTN
MEEAVYTAALEETAELGLARVTMEGIARRADTAKTSLYRRWSSPEDIVLRALYRAYPVEQPSPGADDLRGDSEAQRRPDLHERLYAEVFDARGSRFTRTVLRHYADNGQIDPARLTPVVADIGEALMLKYGIDSMELPGDDYIAAIVDQAILPAVGRAPDARDEDRRGRLE